MVVQKLPRVPKVLHTVIDVVHNVHRRLFLLCWRTNSPLQEVDPQSFDSIPTIRCPYCGSKFRPMVVRIEGWLQCENCGHNAMPQDPDFECVCASCLQLADR
jgi:DNA-directed RNA polymerase subunit RPC12/RpoP